MIKWLINLSFYKKSIIYSCLLVILVSFLTAVISYQIQANVTKRVLTDQAMSVAGLWKTTININDIKVAKAMRDKNSISVLNLNEQVNQIHLKHSNYSQGYLLDSMVTGKSTIQLLATPDTLKEEGMNPFMSYKAGEEFSKAYKKAVRTKSSATTKKYKDQYGTWITAFAPILDNDGEVIAIFGVDMEASVISTVKKQLLLYLVSGTVLTAAIIIIFHYIFMRRMMNPLNELFEGIHQVSTGNFSYKVKQLDRSEIGQLSRKFNDMTKKLQLLFERVSVTSEYFGDKDITEVKELKGFEKAIGEMESIIKKTKLQQDLQRAEKMNAIGQLAASVAHEIRNPMTVVKGFLQLFYNREKMGEEDREYIKLMITEMDRAENIINEYLSLAKPNVEDLEVIDCTELIHSVADLMSSYALLTSGITIELEVEDSLSIKGSKSELKQVFLNIMKNGIEAMKDGGRLFITVKKANSMVAFVIADTGVGMTKEEVKRLGTPFYSLKEKGTGIGLMVCYQIIERMKGRIEVQSEKGKGTSFTIELPYQAK